MLNYYSVVSIRFLMVVTLIVIIVRAFIQRSVIIWAIFVEGIKRNYSVKSFFEFEYMVQEEMSFKILLIWSSGDPPVQWSRTIYLILKAGIIGNIHVKLY